MSVDVEMALHDRLQMKPKEFDRYFTVDEAAGNIVIAIRKGRRGRTVWLDRSVWTAVNRYVKDNDGEWHKTTSQWTIPLEKIMQPEDDPKLFISKRPKK